MTSTATNRFVSSRGALLLVMVAALGVVYANAALQQPASMAASNHRFEKVVDGVYAAFPTARGVINSNSVVIVGDRDVLLFDTHSTPAYARDIIQDIKTITDKPIRYVVNSHYHFDHAHGNQVFPPEMP